VERLKVRKIMRIVDKTWVTKFEGRAGTMATVYNALGDALVSPEELYENAGEFAMLRMPLRARVGPLPSNCRRGR
jgi:hypothetical protein